MNAIRTQREAHGHLGGAVGAARVEHVGEIRARREQHEERQAEDHPADLQDLPPGHRVAGWDTRTRGGGGAAAEARGASRDWSAPATAVIEPPGAGRNAVVISRKRLHLSRSAVAVRKRAAAAAGIQMSRCWKRPCQPRNAGDATPITVNGWDVPGP